MCDATHSTTDENFNSNPNAFNHARHSPSLLQNRNINTIFPLRSTELSLAPLLLRSPHARGWENMLRYKKGG